VELGDLGFDGLLPLGVCETMCLVFLRLRGPVLRFVCRLEGRVFSDGGVRIFVDILHIFGTNTIFQIRSELLLETIVNVSGRTGYF
jgi:hypothetical protein